MITGCFLPRHCQLTANKITGKESWIGRNVLSWPVRLKQDDKLLLRITVLGKNMIQRGPGLKARGRNEWSAYLASTALVFSGGRHPRTPRRPRWCHTRHPGGLSWSARQRERPSSWVSMCGTVQPVLQRKKNTHALINSKLIVLWIWNLPRSTRLCNDVETHVTGMIRGCACSPLSRHRPIRTNAPVITDKVMCTCWLCRAVYLD